MLTGERPIPQIDPAELATDWITTEEAAEILCVTERSLQKVRGQTVRRIRGRLGDRVGPDGYLWWRRDVEDLARIKKRSRLSLNVALRVMAAERLRR